MSSSPKTSQRREAAHMIWRFIFVAMLLLAIASPVSGLQAEDEPIVDTGEFLQHTDVAIKSGRFVQAGEMLSWLEQNAGTIFQDDVNLLRAEYAIATGSDADAAVAVAKITDKSRNACRQDVVRGWIAGKKNDLNRSILFLARSTGLCPSDAGAWNLLGLAFINKGEARAGKEAFEQALALSPDAPGLLNNYALALVQIEDYPAALGLLGKALAFDPDNRLIADNRDFVMGMTGETPERKAHEGDTIWAQRLINVGHGANALRRDAVATAMFAQAILLIDHFDEQAWSVASRTQGQISQ